jgi:hypothetical protein
MTRPSTISALSGVANANQASPTVITGGQPSARHFQALKDAGVEVVLDIRDPMEPRGFDEEALMNQLGLEYINIVVTDAQLNDTTLDAVTGAMRSEGRRRWSTAPAGIASGCADSYSSRSGMTERSYHGRDADGTRGAHLRNGD